jgi:hypothetical protein
MGIMRIASRAAQDFLLWYERHTENLKSYIPPSSKRSNVCTSWYVRAKRSNVIPRSVCTRSRENMSEVSCLKCKSYYHMMELQWVSENPIPGVKGRG